MNVNSRLQKLRQKLVEKEIDGIFISQPENRNYLSGFDGSDGFLLITQNEAILATDFRYIEQCKEQSPDYQICRISGTFQEWFPNLLKESSLNSLGFESENLTFAQYSRVIEAVRKSELKLKPIGMGGVVEALRQVKEPEEIELIVKAMEIADKAFAYAESIISIGMTEAKLSWELEKYMRDNGSQVMPFDVIVAAGTNAALPHHKPSDHPIAAGEPVIIDMGARVGGYASDGTRTLCIGAQDKTFRKVYDTVLGAQLTAEAIIKEGMTGEEADHLARIVIEEAGYGEAFGHSLGHGVGLAVHEMPRVGPKSADKLADGMVFTVEPGIYLPGWGGVRIEDTVVMEDGKIKVLTKARKS